MATSHGFRAHKKSVKAKVMNFAFKIKQNSFFDIQCTLLHCMSQANYC